MTPDQHAVLLRREAKVAFAAGEVTQADLDALLHGIDGDNYFANLFDDMEDDDE